MVITTDNVAEMLHLADKYDVDELVKGCELFMIEYLNIANALEYHTNAMRFTRANLNTKCLELIRKKYYEVLKSNTFTQCEIATLAEFLRMIPDCSRVEDVFDACIEWSTAKCQQKGIDESSMENLRSELGECFGLIPFKEMAFQAFVDRHKRFEAIFTKDESVNILMHLSERFFKRYQFEIKDEYKLKFNGAEDYYDDLGHDEHFCFKTTKHLLLHSVNFRYENSNFYHDDFEFSAEITVMGDNQVVFCQKTTLSKNKQQFTFPIKVTMDPGTLYEIRISKESVDDVELVNYIYERQKLRGVHFIPYDYSGNVTDCTGYPIRSIEFLDVVE